jgi:hypothetical protein
MGAKVGNWRSAMTLVALYHYVDPKRTGDDIRRAICQDFPFARHFADAINRSLDELAIVDFLRGIQRRRPLPSAELTAFLEGDAAPGLPRYSRPTRREYYRRLNVLTAHVVQIRHDHFARKADALAAVEQALRARGERPAKGSGNVWVLFDTRCRQRGVDPLALADPEEAMQDFDDYLRQTLHLDEGTRRRYRSVVTGYLTRLGVRTYRPAHALFDPIRHSVLERAADRGIVTVGDALTGGHSIEHEDPTGIVGQVDAIVAVREHDEVGVTGTKVADGWGHVITKHDTGPELLPAPGLDLAGAENHDPPSRSRFRAKLLDPLEIQRPVDERWDKDESFTERPWRGHDGMEGSIGGAAQLADEHGVVRESRGHEQAM